MNVVVQGRVVERRDCTVGGIEMEKSLVFCAEPYSPVIASAELTDGVSQVSHVVPGIILFEVSILVRIIGDATEV